MDYDRRECSHFDWADYRNDLPRHSLEKEAQKWCAATGKKYNAFHKKLITEFIDEEICKLQSPNLIQPITKLYPTWL